MKKMRVSSIPILIGCANWIIVLLNLLIFIMIIESYPKVTPKSLSVPIDFMEKYIEYSFIPALISIVLTIKVEKGYKLTNLGINILFLLLYTLVFLFFRALISG